MFSRSFPKLTLYGSPTLPHLGALWFRKASLSEELGSSDEDQLFVQEAELTRDSAHRALHEVASVPSHMGSKAVADQVNISERKIILLLQESTKVCQ